MTSKTWDEYAADQRHASEQELVAIKKILQSILNVLFLFVAVVIVFSLLILSR